MARHARKLLSGASAQLVGRSGKLKSITLTATGDRIYNLREVNGSGNVIYKLNTALLLPHEELNLSFRDALYAESVSGTTGECNVIYE